MSVLSYVRLRCSLDEAMDRYGRWVSAPEVAPRRMVREREMIDLSMKDDNWLGLAVFIYSSGERTIVEEISGGLAGQPAERWVELAQNDDLVYAGYNDSIPYAELVVVQRGQLVRHFLQDEQDPSNDVDFGQLPEESKDPFKDWTDATRWIEEDELNLERPDEGWLWIHHHDW